MAPGADRDVLVLGASGFIGSAVAREARRRQVLLQGASRSKVSILSGDAELDLTDGPALRRLMLTARVVIVSVSYVGKDSRLARETNVDGIRAIVESRGPARVIYVSTAAVSGAGPHRGPPPRVGDIAPQSIASSTRAEAEQRVLEAEGIVVRPNLVYGVGDRWFIPSLVSLLQRDPNGYHDWHARVSTVHVDDLARGLVGLAMNLTASGSQVLSLDASRPTVLSDVGRLISRIAAPPPPPSAITDPPAAAAAGRWRLTPHQESMLTTDNWFDSAAGWTAAGTSAPHSFFLRQKDIEWYRSRRRA